MHNITDAIIYKGSELTILGLHSANNAAECSKNCSEKCRLMECSEVAEWCIKRLNKIKARSSKILFTKT